MMGPASARRAWLASGVCLALEHTDAITAGCAGTPGLAGSPMLDVFRQTGFPVAAEAFADRRYEPDGTLRSRKHPDALIHDPTEAAQQALAIAQGKVVARDGSVLFTPEANAVRQHSAAGYALIESRADVLKARGIALASAIFDDIADTIYVDSSGHLDRQGEEMLASFVAGEAGLKLAQPGSSAAVRAHSSP